MQWCYVFTLCVAIVLQSSVLGLAKKKEEKSHATKSNVHEIKKTSSQNLLKSELNAAPLGMGIGLKANVPEASDKSKKDDKDIKTESETTTETNGPFKTITTVTKQTKMGKNNKPEVIGQSVEKVMTNIFDSKKPGKYKVGKAKGKHGFMLDIFNPFGLGGLFGDEPAKQCSPKKHCKKPGMYCDRMDNQCRKKVKLDGRCDQAGQCDTDEKQHVTCLWGRCSLVKKTSGNAGVFCKENKDCGSEDLHCGLQLDISEVSKVCIYKLNEGQTCGRSRMFSFFPFGGLTHDQPCKKGYTCQELSFTGRKICRRSDEEDENED